MGACCYCFWLKTHKGNDGFKTCVPKVNKKGVCGSEWKGGDKELKKKKKEKNCFVSSVSLC